MSQDMDMKDLSVSGPSSDAGSELNEKAALVAHEHRVDGKTAERLRKAILIISWFSVIVIGSLGVATLSVAVTANSSASFAFSLDAFLDVLSSLVVIWRFTGEAGDLYSRKKEAIACSILGALFLLSSICIGARSIYSLSYNEHPAIESIMWYLYSTNAIICTILMICKVYLGWKLESKSILTDAVNSFIGAMLSFASVVGDIVYQHYMPAWMIDPSVGIVCAVLLWAYGLWILILSIREYKETCEKIENSK